VESLVKMRRQFPMRHDKAGLLCGWVGVRVQRKETSGVDGAVVGGYRETEEDRVLRHDVKSGEPSK